MAYLYCRGCTCCLCGVRTFVVIVLHHDTLFLSSPSPLLSPPIPPSFLIVRLARPAAGAAARGAAAGVTRPAFWLGVRVNLDLGLDPLQPCYGLYLLRIQCSELVVRKEKQRKARDVDVGTKQLLLRTEIR